ncbi:hypothetical protein F4776DRAFT_90307 [Hypoxylon sp. NC0597]|nr:hypothetical protein F4776DRAFT_90307 [Hypoxylon sp. NC0597]
MNIYIEILRLCTLVLGFLHGLPDDIHGSEKNSASSVDQYKVPMMFSILGRCKYVQKTSSRRKGRDMTSLTLICCNKTHTWMGCKSEVR